MYRASPSAATVHHNTMPAHLLLQRSIIGVSNEVSEAGEGRDIFEIPQQDATLERFWHLRTIRTPLSGLHMPQSGMACGA